MSKADFSRQADWWKDPRGANLPDNATKLAINSFGTRSEVISLLAKEMIAAGISADNATIINSWIATRASPEKLKFLEVPAPMGRITAIENAVAEFKDADAKQVAKYGYINYRNSVKILSYSDDTFDIVRQNDSYKSAQLRSQNLQRLIKQEGLSAAQIAKSVLSGGYSRHDMNALSIFDISVLKLPAELPDSRALELAAITYRQVNKPIFLTFIADSLRQDFLFDSRLFHKLLRK